MQKIEGVELPDLVAQAANELVNLQRDEAITLIKRKLERVAGLTAEIKKLKNDIKTKEEKLEKTLGLIEKLRSGDWSVLQEEQQQKSE